MTVRRREDGTIALEGPCGVEDAEPLLQMLIAAPAASVDWSACDHLHSAVLQILLSARPAVTGPCGDAWVGRWIAWPARAGEGPARV